MVAPPARRRRPGSAAATRPTSDIDALLRSLLDQGVPASTVAQALRVDARYRSEPGVRACARARPRASVARMAITRVVGKGRTDGARRRASSRELPRAATRTTSVDVGTGDGRFAYHLASSRPGATRDRFDALAEPMGEIARDRGPQAREGWPAEPGVRARARSRRCRPSSHGRCRRGVRAAPVGRPARRDRARPRRRARRDSPRCAGPARASS